MKMKTATINIYEFSELSEQAQEQARYSFISNGGYSWAGGQVDSLKAFCEHFNLNLDDYSYGNSSCRDNFVRVSVKNEDIAELSNAELLACLNDSGFLIVPGTKWSDKQKAIINTGKKVSLLGGQCPFTGVCHDEDLLDDLRSFVKSTDDRTYQELMQDCADTWLKSVIEECDYQESMEYFKEIAEANDYQFTEDGSIH